MITAFPNITQEKTVAGISDGPTSADKNRSFAEIVELYVILCRGFMFNEVPRTSAWLHSEGSAGSEFPNAGKAEFEQSTAL